VVWGNVNDHYEWELMDVTRPVLGKGLPRWIIDFLRGLVSDIDVAEAGIDGDRFYISRGAADIRRITNEEEVKNLMVDHGFVPVQLESMPWRSQVALMKKSRLLVGAHGSGLANMVFMQEGSGVVELMSGSYVNALYWQLAGRVGLKYNCLVDTSDADVSELQTGRDIYVDVNDLERVIRSFS